MITVQLIGGLGNQMFQYAIGRAISYRNRFSLKLDISAFADYPLRDYRLGNFNIIEDFATQRDLARYSPRRTQPLRWLTDRFRRQFSPYYRQLIVKEPHISYAPAIRSVKGPAYLIGYWQSEKYFADISEVIRREFTPRVSPDPLNQHWLSQILCSDSVSLHIRRGDYVTNPKTSRSHGFVGLDYYERAMDYLESIVHSPAYFVFSDDIAWAKEHLSRSSSMYFIDHNGESGDYLDMWLMRHCKHHITANSSFSWWAAWLCEHSDKLVIAPCKWFAELDVDSASRFPEAWILL